jgi:hypothetical protein
MLETKNGPIQGYEGTLVKYSGCFEFDDSSRYLFKDVRWKRCKVQICQAQQAH